MKDDTKHSPTPWIAKGTSVYSGDLHHVCGGTGEEIKYRYSFTMGTGWGTIEQRKIDARHIVRCVNSHDALREALEALLADIDSAEVDGVPVSKSIREQARAALARAREEK